MASRFVFDLLSAIALAFTAAIGAYLPVFLCRRHQRKGGTGRSLSFVIGNMLSAGVMVSAGFCHLLGDAILQMPQFHEFPLAPFLCGCGFLLTLCADSAATALSGGGSHIVDGGELGVLELAIGEHKNKSSDISGTCLDELENGSELLRDNSVLGKKYISTMHQSIEDKLESNMINLDERTDSISMESSPLLHRKMSQECDDDQCRHSPVDELESGRSTAVDTRAGTGTIYPVSRDILSVNVDSVRLPQEAAASISLNEGQRPSRRGMPSSVHGHCHPGHLAIQAHDIPGGSIHASVSFITAVLMGVALCFHSLLEGAAMGTQDTVANSLHIFIAIVSHKGLAAYALGSSIVDSNVG